MEQEFKMTTVAEMIWDELGLDERIEIFWIIRPGKSMARAMNRALRHIENNIEKYQHLIGH